MYIVDGSIYVGYERYNDVKYSFFGCLNVELRLSVNYSWMEV